MNKPTHLHIVAAMVLAALVCALAPLRTAVAQEAAPATEEKKDRPASLDQARIPEAEKPVQAEKIKPFELRQLVVTGTRTEKTLKDTPVETVVITRKQIREMAAQDVGDVLDFTPGIQLESFFGGVQAQVSVEGLFPQQTKILVDGQRYSGGLGDPTDLRDIPISMVERIEVIRGASSVLYGSDALGGVINIITKDGVKESYSASAGYGTFDKFVGTVNHGNKIGKFGYFLTYNRDEVNDDIFDNGILFKSNDVNGKLTYDFSDRTLVTLRGGYRDEKQPFKFAGTKQTEDKVNVSLRLDHEFVPGRKLTATADYFDFNLDSNVLVTDLIHTTERQRRLLLQYDHRWRNHLITSGTTIRAEDFDDTGSADVDAAQQWYSFFVQDDVKITDSLQAVGAIRLDKHSVFANRLIPKLSLLYKLTSSTDLRFTVGTGWRAPTFVNLFRGRTARMGGLYFLEGNRGLKPETTLNFRFGVNQRFSPTAIGSISFFRNDVANLIQAQNTRGPEAAFMLGDTFKQQNINEAQTQGLEASLQKRWFGSFLTRVGYTLLFTKNQTLNKELRNRPRHTVDGRLQWNIKRLGLSWNLSLKWRDVSFANTSNSARNPSSFMADTKIVKKLFDNFGLWISVENLTDTGRSNGFNIPGRGFFSGVRADF